MKRRIISIFGFLSFASAFHSSGEEVVVSNDRIRVEAGDSVRFALELPRAIQGEDAVITLEAWMHAESFSGFSGAFRVFWNGIELKRALGRPETIRTQNGYTMQSYSDHGGWQAAYAGNPDQVRGVDVESGYNFIDAQFDMIRYVLPLPSAAARAAEVEIRSTTEEAALMIQNISITID